MARTLRPCVRRSVHALRSTASSPLLGPEFELLRVTPRGLTPLDYDPAAEMFLEETNYAAIQRGVLRFIEQPCIPG